MPLKGTHKREYQKRWLHQRRAAFLSDKSCLWCGSTQELELHHQDPNEKVSSAIWSWSEERRNREIAKCIILCKCCHRRHHADELRGQPRKRITLDATLVRWDSNPAEILSLQSSTG